MSCSSFDIFDVSSRTLAELSPIPLNAMLSHSYNSMVEDRSYTCKACGASFSTHQGLVNHNVDSHGAAIGTQLRPGQAIQK